MGARSPTNQRLRRGSLKCEFCSRSFPSALSLHSHQNSLHASALKEKEKKALSKKPGKVQKGVAKVIVKPKLKLVKAKPKVLQAKKSLRKEAPAKQTETVAKSAKVKEDTKEKQVEKKLQMDLKPSTGVRKVEFKCPVCIRTFPVYFSAKKHIQKHHCNKALSSKVIEPIRTEVCIFCNKMVSDGLEDHICDSEHDLTGLSMTYICTGCNQNFQSMRLFDMHISGVHSEGVESMFFPTLDEFNNWKNAMEEQTKSSYLVMGKYQYKKIYRCSKTTVKDEADESGPAHFCPSTLIFQEFTKGIQVHFYKEHYGHSGTKYVLQDQDKKYSLTDMLHRAIGYSEIMNVKSEEGDLYCQFKNLMESIVVDAAKVNVETLQKLVGKSLEMISVLKNYNTDYDEENLKLSSNSGQDHKLAKALDVLNNVSKPTKRSIKTAIEVVPAKRLNNTEPLEKSPILQKVVKSKPPVNKLSLADDRNDQKILKELGGANVNMVSSPIAVPVKKSVDSPSFNDSYKDFVEKNLKTTTVKSPAPTKNSTPVPAKKKNVLKTKMGQFKPETSPKKPVQNGTLPTEKASKPSSGKTSTEKPSTEKPSTEELTTEKPSTEKLTTEKPSTEKPETEKPETEKPGTEKPSAAKPSTATPSVAKPSARKSNIGKPSTRKLSIGKPSDVEYEVKEQENDCNILILKI